MEKIKQINEKEYDGMIIDLRDNSEGSINNAYNIANIFLKENTVFSIIKKKKGNESMIISQFDKKMLDIPLIVLINKNTAKYSEVLAASFKDNQRAVIIGQPSSGLAFHQESFTLSDGSIAKFTTGYYLSPSEKEIHGKGVSPDITIEKEYEIEKNENVKIRIEKDTVIQRAKEFIKFFKK
jgi:carboxyl-terminal processing protease